MKPIIMSSFSIQNKGWLLFHRKHLFLLLLLSSLFQVAWCQKTMVLVPSAVTQGGSSPTNNNSALFEISGADINDQMVNTRFVTLNFDLRTVPAEAIVTSWAIRIYLQGQDDNTDNQFVQLFVPAQPSSAVGSAEINKFDKDKGKDLEVTVAGDDQSAWPSKHPDTTLTVILKANTQKYRYYSKPSASTEETVINRQPKLIINYYMPPLLVEANWSQHKNDPQHTGKSHWMLTKNLTGLKVDEIAGGATDADVANWVEAGKANAAMALDKYSFMMGKPVIYDQLLVFHYQHYKDPKYRIRALSSNGQLAMPDKDVGGVVNFQPVMDHSGRLYCIVANDMLKILDLNNQLRIISSTRLGNGAQVKATPVVGYDGSLYLSTNQGIYAYTPYPDFKVKWKYTSGTNDFGSVALSEDEKTLYVINGTTKKLLALDNTEGNFIWEKGDFVLDKGDFVLGKGMPLPIVNKDQVIVLDGGRRGHRFTIVNSSGATTIKEAPRREATEGQVSQPVLGQVSQPVLGTQYAYIIRDGTLEALSLDNASRQYSSGNKGLNPASAMVVDGNDNIYVLSFEPDNQSIRVFNSTCTEIASDPLTGWEHLAAGHLILAPDGNLYTDSRGKLYVIRPVFAPQDQLNLGQLEDQRVYRGASWIRVGPTALKETHNAILYADKKISFQNGFRVEKGAKLTCKTGY